MRNAGGHQSKNEQQWEKVNRNIYNISSKKKPVPRKFLEVVVVQNNAKEMYKKVWLHAQSFFFC